MLNRNLFAPRHPHATGQLGQSLSHTFLRWFLSSFALLRKKGPNSCRVSPEVKYKISKEGEENSWERKTSKNAKEKMIIKGGNIWK